MAARRKQVWLPKLVLALSAGLALSACQNTTANEAPKSERPVLTTTVKSEPRITRRSFVATIRPRFESELGFRVAGKVARRLVNVGDVVKRGRCWRSWTRPICVSSSTKPRLSAMPRRLR